jgi:transcriptional regulator with XRE-family HTH domain
MMQTAQPVGTLLREWRQRRRLTQLDLALDADISPRHLSFVETGRSQPSREMLLHLSEALEVPLRERNALLVAAGYAPMFRERSSTTPRSSARGRRSTGCSKRKSPFPPSPSTGTGTSSPRTARCRSSTRA